MLFNQSRRSFVLSASITGVLSVGGYLPTKLLAASSAPRRLAFQHLHTGESLAATYWSDGAYIPEALRDIGHVLRDHRSNTSTTIDINLLEILRLVQMQLEVSSPFEVISGYRSKATNDMLRARSNGVAKRSLHMQGRAIDVRIAGKDTRTLRDAAAGLKVGGVGYYPRSNFIHLDTGRPRTWG